VTGVPCFVVFLAMFFLKKTAFFRAVFFVGRRKARNEREREREREREL
jgi:ribose/xylose/arabinose/galactoside ABC-type transport system permease subunit